jgi:hypothetical protein
MYVCVLRLICVKGNRGRFFPLVSAFFWITQVQRKSESKVLAPEQKCKNLMRQKSREKIKEANFRSKKIQKRKNFSSLSCCPVGGVVVVACTYFIRGKYILTTLTNNFSTRAFSERERERERERV